MEDSNQCPFCAIVSGPEHPRIIDEDKLAFTIRDGYPVTEGHSLIIPKRHVASFFDLSPTEKASMLELLESQQAVLSTELSVSDFNVGINDGKLAGQTVPHCHVHLIPRTANDVNDPRGGVRWVIPAKAKYWKNV